MTSTKTQGASAPAKVGPKTKAALVNDIAAAVGLTKEEVASVLAALEVEAREALGEGGPGAFTVPGLVRLKLVARRATRERTARGPRGTPVLIPAKPARRAIHVKVYEPLKRSFATGGTEAAP
jgi:nucleoid DNA-binding protein